MRSRARLFASLLAIASFTPAGSYALGMPGPLADLQVRLTRAADRVPGTVGVAVEDLATGYVSGVNESASLPAASTIKIPVMVEVFRQMQSGTIDLNTALHLQASDRDWGWGDLAGAPTNTRRTVKQLLRLMIEDSDNTATNMLIRLVGRRHINVTMARLGLRKTRLSDYIRSQTDAIRYALRTSPSDMVKLLDAMARDELVDQWSSRQMLAILAGQLHNSLLPVPLPRKLRIAHKTGTLHDTLNDVGIVFRDQEPYVIAVMTTGLPDLDFGRSFIHKVSRLAYDELGRLERWRIGEGLPGFTPLQPLPQPASDQPLAPDQRMWEAPGSEPAVDPTSPGDNEQNS